MLAIDLSLNEAADQIGAWIGRTLVIDLLKVSADGFGASLDLCKAVDTIGGAVASSEKIVNPVLEIHPPGNVAAPHLGAPARERVVSGTRGSESVNIGGLRHRKHTS